MITPRTLKGFRDLLPHQAWAREMVIDTARDIYRLYGYLPIDTPALEYTEILLGKGSDESDKQLYRFEDHGGRDIALRFDLTIPFARFAAQHGGVLGTPFKRYHVGPVWRGEKPQKGRYREFLQCDFDTIGTESSVADAETVLVLHDLFDALELGEFTIRFNDRRVLNGMLDGSGVGDTVPILRAIDKLPKIGEAGVKAELVPLIGEGPADQLLALVSISGSNESVVTQLADIAGDSEMAQAGVASLRSVLAAAAAAGIPESRLAVDVSIARGLDYYTGIVFETFLDELPGIGSCASGGRYDDLAGVYTKQRLPGVGASLGVDRVLAAMEELGLVAEGGAAADVLVTLFDAEGVLPALELAADLRAAGISTELYPDPKKLGSQLKYADRRGHRLALIAGPDERAGGTVQIKSLATGEATFTPRIDIVSVVQEALQPST